MKFSIILTTLFSSSLTLPSLEGTPLAAKSTPKPHTGFREAGIHPEITYYQYPSALLSIVIFRKEETKPGLHSHLLSSTFPLGSG